MLQPGGGDGGSPARARLRGGSADPPPRGPPIVGGEDLPGRGLVGESTSGTLIVTLFAMGSVETAGVENWAASATISSMGSVTSWRPDLAEALRPSEARFAMVEATAAPGCVPGCATMRLSQYF